MTMTNEPKDELSVVPKKPVVLPFDVTQLKSPPYEIPILAVLSINALTVDITSTLF